MAELHICIRRFRELGVASCDDGTEGRETIKGLQVAPRAKAAFGGLSNR
nr:hypothetical protein Itr_chr14CG23410 [Ipomoea trifida]